jgi:hypothetical protein
MRRRSSAIGAHGFQSGNGGRNRATAQDFPFVNALSVAQVHDMVQVSRCAAGGVLVFS